jgi:hypothetical protein
MAKVVQHQPSKQKALSLNLSAAKKKKKRKKEEKTQHISDKVSLQATFIPE